MFPAGFEPAIPTFEQPQTQALVCAALGIGYASGTLRRQICSLLQLSNCFLGTDGQADNHIDTAKFGCVLSLTTPAF